MNPIKIAAIAISIATTSFVHAGIYADDLSRCLVESSTADDKITLAKWMFTAMTLHPSVKDLSSATDNDRRISSQNMADLIVDLVSVRCVEQSKKAIKYEGQVALQTSFTILGQVAAQELFANQAVAKELADIENHMNVELVNKRLGITE